MRGPDCADCKNWTPSRGFWAKVRRFFLGGYTFADRVNSACWSGSVKEVFAEQARAFDGDCGPNARHFEGKR